MEGETNNETHKTLT